MTENNSSPDSPEFEAWLLINRLTAKYLINVLKFCSLTYIELVR